MDNAMSQNSHIKQEMKCSRVLYSEITEMITTTPFFISPTTSSFVSLPKPQFSYSVPSFHNNNNNKNTLFLLFSSKNKNTPETECPVPLEQQPINEYQSLSTSFPFSWASGDVVEYGSRLVVTGAAFAILVGLPVAWYGTVGAESEPLKRIVCGASSGVFVVTLAVLRMYLGWAYVGNRLLSATIQYEETGWYDGRVWVKTAEVLARDRLLGSFSVKPVLSRLKTTLVTLATSLLICALVLVNIDGVENYLTPKDTGIRVVPGVYNDDSARSFEPDAFCGETDLQ